MKKLIIVLLSLTIFTTVFVAGESSESDEDGEEVERILHGLKAMPKSFPFQVSIQEKMLGGTAKFCGGVIIAPQWILTASHCFEDIANKSSFSNDLRIKAGVIKASSFSSHSQFVKVTKIITHPDYDKNGNTENDICLLLLKRPLQYNKFVSPISLPSKKYKAKGNGQIVGWGAVDHAESQASENLKYATLEVSKMSDCQAYWTMSKGQICLGFGQKENACAGDSGGPFVQTIKGKKTVVGVTSFGTPGCFEHHPIVYTEVAHFVDWIRETMLAEKQLLIKLKKEHIPYLVPIYIKNSEDLTYEKLGSGVILNDRFVLTSAHSLENVGEDARHNLRIRIKAKKPDQVSPGDFMQVKKVIRPGEYDETSATLFNDFVLLKTRSKLKFEENDLTNITIMTNVTGSQAQIIGYGYTEGNTSEILMRTSVKLAPNKCGVLPKGYENKEWQTCVVATGDSFCHPDSNAPVVMTIDKKPYLFGLNSFAGFECKERKPFLISNMEYYTELIGRMIRIHTSS